MTHHCSLHWLRIRSFFAPVNSLPDQLDPAIERAAFHRVVRGHRPRGSNASSRKPAVVKVIATDKRLLDRSSASAGEILVEGVTADVVGVALHSESPIRTLAHDLSYFVEHFFGFGTQNVAAEVEIDVVDFRSSVLLQFLRESTGTSFGAAPTSRTTASPCRIICCVPINLDDLVATSRF